MSGKKRKKYNPDDIFKTVENKNVNYVQQENLPVEVKQLKFYEKVFNFIKELFGKLTKK
jgi:hypothetical protein